VAQLKLKRLKKKKQMMMIASKHKNYRVYTRDQLLVTGFWRVRKLILSSIIGHHGLVAKKKAFSRSMEP
jgi:hypothetical protein